MVRKRISPLTLISLLLVMLSSLLLFGCQGDNEDDNPVIGTDCKTKYPVVLSYHWGGTVPGTSHNGTPTSGKLGSFNLGMVEALEAQGASVLIADKYDQVKGRYDTTEERANKLAAAIEQFLDETRPADWDEASMGKWKVNLIGHSQGAVDARYMIAKLNAGDGTPMHELVATYTSLAGIHGGSLLADLAVDAKEKIGEEMLSSLITLFFDDDVDEAIANPGFWPSMECLTTDYMAVLNAELTPIETGLSDVVYRKSYAAKIKSHSLCSEYWPEAYLAWKYIKDHDDGGDNDFFVTVEDQTFGATEVLTGADWFMGIPHMAFSTMAMPKLSGDLPWDVNRFYIDLVNELKTDGF
ncbi:MAG: hypothetical protein GY754_34540 [bacterium]|nr:hypothetical protein [bacterium]